ncbi:MAG: GTPase Era [Candidatus Omnitrophica bacterium]|nr:GTPase Era [Candidatus Omnitrophota bacterium]
MDNKEFKSGFVGILGRPNVGKSTLLNALIANRISIISPIPQTTRHQIKGILNLKDAQIVFVDTPGIHSFRDSLTEHLNTIAKQSIEGCDIILYMADVSRHIGPEEQEVINFLIRQDVKIIMVLNKMDLGAKYMNDYIAAWKEALASLGISKDPLLLYLPLSAKSGKNIDELKKIIIENLPQGAAFYDAQTVTDFPLKFRIADVVREQLFLHLAEELPHSLAVEVEEIKEKQKVTVILVNIYVNRISQKKIIIGKKGELLKKIGTSARHFIEQILGRKVYLELWVKVLEDWQNKPRILQELGYWIT